MKYLLFIALAGVAIISCKKKEKDPEVVVVEPIFKAGAGMLDFDSNAYASTIIVGSGEWTTTNLKAVHFSNGDTIFSGRNLDDITAMAQPSFYFYSNNDSTTVNKYGRLYTYYVVEDSRNMCASGWHIPTKAEYDTLIKYLGGQETGGGKMKATSLWAGSNEGADNASNYSALPAGYRTPNESYPEVTKTGIFWTATQDTANRAWSYYLKYNYPTVFQAPSEKNKAYSVRCKRD